MTEFTGADLSGSRFEDVSLARSEFLAVDLSGTRFRRVSLKGAVVRGADLRDVDIDGWIENFRVNGVDVVPLVEAELNRRHPERAGLRPRDTAGCVAAWDTVERLWAETVERARGLDERLLHERVAGEWSFVETLRHLVFVTDAWVSRALLGRSAPWHPLGLPHDEMPDEPGVPRDREARPTLAEVLAARAERMAVVRGVVEAMTEAGLAESTTPVAGPGYPATRSYPVRDCLEIVFMEEWEHRRYALRDLDLLAFRT